MPHILRADQVPAPAAATTFLNPSSLTPTVSPELSAGDTTALLSKFNELSARVDAGGRAIGAYAVSFGLTLSAASGLDLTIAAGQAVMDSVVTVPSNLTVALPDNTLRVYVWLSQAGAPSLVSNSLTAPGANYCFLGSAVTSAGAISSVDDSGVVRICGSLPFRLTFDSSAPTDVPPQAALITIGNGGVWFWDCTAHRLIQGGRAVLTFSSDGNKVLGVADYENDTLDFVNTSGSTLTATRNVTLPTHPGRTWTVRNNSLGGQSLVLKTSGGTGPTLATGKTQNMFCDGVDIIASAAPFP